MVMARLKIVIFCILCLSLVACGENPLVKAVNSMFPPVDRTKQALAALDASRRSLSGLKHPNVSISLVPNDIRPLVAKMLSERIPQVKSATLTFEPQRIGIEAAFDALLSDDNVRVVGKLAGYVLVSVQTQALILTPVFTNIEASEIEYKGNKETNVLIPLLNAAVRSFIDNINGKLKPTKLGLDLDHVFTWDLTNTLKGTPGVVSVDELCAEVGDGMKG
jgi:hypothetical protein